METSFGIPLTPKKKVDPEPERYYDWMVWKGKQLDEEQIKEATTPTVDQVVARLERIERKLDELLERKNNSTV
jgi:hypothetical protein